MNQHQDTSGPKPESDPCTSSRARIAKNRSELKFYVEPLEPRFMLSGNVIATVAGSDILIQGDDWDNEISIELIDSHVVLVGDNQTTINGSLDDFILFDNVTQAPGDVRVHLGDGNDLFAIRDGIGIEQSVVIFSGSGDNSIGVGQSSIGRNLKVSTGDGDNKIALNETEIGQDLKVYSRSGDDVVSILNSTIGDDIHLRTGRGNDGILIESSEVGGNAKAITQRDNDDFVIRNSEIAGNVVTVMGAGDDFHCIEPSFIGGKTIAVMNSGADEVIYAGLNVFNGTQIVIGGIGADRFELTSENQVLNGSTNVSNESDDVPTSTTDFRLSDAQQGLFNRSAAAQEILDLKRLPLTLAIDTSSNTTIQSNDAVITKDQSFLVEGITAAGAEVAIDSDNDGLFDDGSTTADASGKYSLTVALVNDAANLGLNDIQIQATDRFDQVATESVRVHYAIGSVVRFDSEFGAFDIELSPDPDLAATVDNFLRYQTDYESSILQRASTNNSGEPFVIQAGGYRLDGGDVVRIATGPAIVNQFKPDNSNLRGTIAMALPQNDLNGATSQWFINLADENAFLDNRSFTVFGRVIGSGMTIVDTLHAIPVSNLTAIRSDAGLFDVPLTNYEQFTQPLSGTVSLTLGQATVVGSGTEFLTELVLGSEIQVEGERYNVFSIASDTELVLESVAVADANDSVALINGNPDLDDYVVFNSISEITTLDGPNSNL